MRLRRDPFLLDDAKVLYGWQGAQALTSKGPSLGPRATSTSSGPTCAISLSMKAAPGKFNSKVLLACLSRSKPSLMTIPAAWSPMLVPPQPQKKSATRIRHFGLLRGVVIDIGVKDSISTALPLFVALLTSLSPAGQESLA